jgi:phenylacetate-CoA ligase
LTDQLTEARRHTRDEIWVEELVAAARSQIPFYRDHLAGFDATSLNSLPSFDKRMTAKHGRFPISAGGAGGAYRVLATSGTSGNRLCVAFDRRDWDRIADRMDEVGQRVGLTSEDVLLNTHCYGLWVGGPVLDLLAQRASAGLVPLGPITAGTVIEFLREGVGTAISATPSYVRRLIEAAEASRFDLTTSPLRIGFIGAEPAEEPLRQKLLARLPDGFRWIELYGLTETGGPCVAFAPDPTIPELELNIRDFRVEVLDLTADVPVELGTVGELTITTRANDCRTPLIRYRTRDLVRVIAQEAGLPTRVSRILGRADDALKVGGVLVYPSAVAEIMSEILPATSEWRAILRRRHRHEELVIEAEAASSVCKTVEDAFQDRVGLRVSVSSVPLDALARSREKTQRVLIASPGATSDTGS